nr:NnrU family protein [Marinobacter similis]
MATLIAGLVLFLGIHSLSIVNEPLRNRLQASLGEGPFKGLYSVIALIGLVLIVVGYGAARLEPTVLYTPPGAAASGPTTPDSSVSAAVCCVPAGPYQNHAQAPDAGCGETLGPGAPAGQRHAA